MISVAVVLAGLGLAFGSFVNALVWRIHKKKKLAKERSQCVHCGHKLAARDLVPVFSWLALRGRCRYCGQPISIQYPLVEATTAAVFVLSYLFWPGGLNGAGDWVLFVTWLAASVGLLALLFYDFRWMLLPNKIIYPTLAVAITGRLIYIIGFEVDVESAVLRWLLSLAVASGIFWLIYAVSKGRWIGFGDVRLGLITGTILADPARSFLMILIASILGTLVVLPELISGKKTISSRLAYGPFLIAATFAVVLFGDTIIDWYEQLFA